MPPYKRQAEPSKGVFLKWEPGETKNLEILSEEGAQSHVHWVEGESKNCEGEDCGLCDLGVRRATRWEVLARYQDEEVPWAMSNQTFYGVEDVAEMTGCLKGLLLRVTRHGTGKTTRYSVLPLIGQKEESETDLPLHWYVDETKRLCALADMDAKQELKRFLTEVSPSSATAKPDVQVRAFYAYIADKTGTGRDEDEPPPEEPRDIGDYF